MRSGRLDRKGCKMMVQYKGNTLTQEEKEQIWEILCECDEEFYPRLSARESSSQKQLKVGVSQEKALPVSYFKEMISQEFLVAMEDGRMTGFMTFKKDYLCDALKDFGKSLYITTICVRKDCRKKGIMRELYRVMEQEMPKKYQCGKVSTRTWSLNEAQLHELEKRGYQRIAVLENDRGNGVDTVYFGQLFII